MAEIQTEFVLSNWRFGSAQAERLCAALLHIDEYKGIDPQCPLGGPDGKKDILCEKEGTKYVVACYFPSTKQEFNDIKKKFTSDCVGIEKNNVDGILFLCNQFITPSERAELLSSASPKMSVIYHVERIRALLDSPRGYGIRLEYLRIPMSESEQISFISDYGNQLHAQITENNRLLEQLSGILARSQALLVDLVSEKSSMLPSAKLLDGIDGIPPTRNLTIDTILWLHRVVTEDSGTPMSNRGKFRSVGVWIGPPGCGLENAEFVPANPDLIPKLMFQLISWWRDDYQSILYETVQVKIVKICEFHHRLLHIHPFLDGNGRIARILLQQQCIELLNNTFSAKLTSEPIAYYNALKSADEGDLSKLILLVSASLESSV